MTNNELLLSISRMLDTKLKVEIQPIKDALQSVKDEVKEINVRLQNVETEVQQVKVEVEQLNGEVQKLKVGVEQVKVDVQKLKDETYQLRLNQEKTIMPRLNTIESCYTGTYNRYRSYVEKMETAFMDIDVLKMVVAEHSEKLLKLA